MTIHKQLEKIKNDPKALYELTLSLLENNDRLEKRVKELEDSAALKRFKQFKTTSEKEYNLFTQEDYEHFNEAEANCDNIKAKIINEITGEIKRIKSKNMVNDLEIETEDVEYTVDTTSIKCECGGNYSEIGSKVSYSMKYIPAKIIRQRNKVYSYKCNNCEETHIISGKRNNPFIKTMVEPSFVAGVIYNKTYNSLPLYRQEREFKSLGLDIRRNNLSNWFIQGANLLNPLFNIMYNDVISNDVIHMDETTLNVIQKKNEKKKNTSGFMWLLRSCKHDAPINLYFYKDSREHYHATDLINNFKGYLHSDGYKGYYDHPGVINVSCWAHARRKVYDALVLANKYKEKNSLSEKLFNLIQKLYKIEQDITKYIIDYNLSKEEIFKYTFEQRNEFSTPILKEIMGFCTSSSLTVLPKSKLGEAIAYINNHKKFLSTYVLDGRLAIDNNISERSAKAFAIGRKNFLFSFSELGAQASAICYSLVHSAAENNLNVFEYLKYVFENLCDVDLKTEDELRKLLPYSNFLPKNLFIKK